MAEVSKVDNQKVVYLSVMEDGVLKLKKPVRSVEMVVGMCQLVDEHTSVTLAVE